MISPYGPFFRGLQIRRNNIRTRQLQNQYDAVTRKKIEKLEIVMIKETSFDENETVVENIRLETNLMLNVATANVCIQTRARISASQNPQC